MGFAAAAVAGAVAGNTTTTVLWRAMLVMGACWVIGWGVGFVTEKAVQEHIDSYKQQHPIPDHTASVDDQGSEAESSVQTDGEVVSST